MTTLLDDRENEQLRAPRLLRRNASLCPAQQRVQTAASNVRRGEKSKSLRPGTRKKNPFFCSVLPDEVLTSDGAHRTQRRHGATVRRREEGMGRITCISHMGQQKKKKKKPHTSFNFLQ